MKVAPTSRVLGVVLGLALATLALTGCTAAEVVAATITPSPSASSSVPTPALTQAPAPSPAATNAAGLNGFDLDSVYRDCDAAVPAGVWGGARPRPPEPRQADSFGIASSDPYTAEHTNGDPNAISVKVLYMSDQTHGFSHYASHRATRQRRPFTTSGRSIKTSSLDEQPGHADVMYESTRPLDAAVAWV